MTRRLLEIWKQAGPPAAAVLLVLVAWQLYADYSGIASWLLPSPLTIAVETVRIFPELWGHTVATVRIAVIGFAAAAATGIGLSVLLWGVVPVLRKPVYPLLIVTQTIPMIVIAPLFAVWFGYGVTPKIIFITIFCFFPILIAALQGYASTDAAMRNYMLMIGATRWQLFRRLEWPSALPYMFAGLRVSTAYSVMAAVVSEWMARSRGSDKRSACTARASAPTGCSPAFS